jgi:hypothetical protein
VRETLAQTREVATVGLLTSLIVAATTADATHGDPPNLFEPGTTRSTNPLGGPEDRNTVNFNNIVRVHRQPPERRHPHLADFTGGGDARIFVDGWQNGAVVPALPPGIDCDDVPANVNDESCAMVNDTPTTFSFLDSSLRSVRVNAEER